MENEVTEPTVSRPPGDWLRVLLIEDDPMAVRTVNVVLRRGFQRRVTTESSTTLEEGLALAESRQFDVVLLDLNLPGVSGVSTLERFFKAGIDCPVIVLTGDDSEEMGIRAVKMGAQDYLVKGEFNEKVLIRALRYAKERYRLQATLRRLAVVDDLTGHFNRRGFFSLAGEALEESRGREIPVGVAFLDLDGFKVINDAFGHETGDWALKVFSDCLRHVFHEGEVVARMGGDEFAIFFPDFDRGRLEQRIGRLSTEVDRICHEREAPYVVRFSYGAAESANLSDGCDLEALTRIADERLYQEKREKGEGRRDVLRSPAVIR